MSGACGTARLTDEMVFQNSALFVESDRHTDRDCVFSFTGGGLFSLVCGNRGT